MLKRLALTALVASSLACGGSIPAAPRVPQRSLVWSGNFGMDPREVVGAVFAVPGAGLLTVIVDWSFASDDIDVLLSNPACATTGPNAGVGCVNYASDVRKFVKPAQLTYQVPAAGSYQVILLNFGPGFETGTVNVYLDR